MNILFLIRYRLMAAVSARFNGGLTVSGPWVSGSTPTTRIVEVVSSVVLARVSGQCTALQQL